MKTLLTVVLNIIGVVLIPILVTMLSGGGTGLEAQSGKVGLNVSLDIPGILVTLVAIIAYFVLARKYWGMTVGGKIVSLLNIGK